LAGFDFNRAFNPQAIAYAPVYDFHTRFGLFDLLDQSVLSTRLQTNFSEQVGVCIIRQPFQQKNEPHYGSKK
jgi:hypothetical protein